MTWLWFFFLGIIALASRRRIAGWVSGWQQESLKSASWIGLIFFGAMALFGTTMESVPLLVHVAAAAAGVLALFTIAEQIRRRTAVDVGAVRRAIDQRKGREREAQQERGAPAAAGSPARVAELLEAQAHRREPQPAEPEEDSEAGRYVVIQVDEGDNVHHVSILGTAADAAGESAAEPAVPAPLVPVDEPVEVETVDAADAPGEAAERALVDAPQARPAGPVSLGGGGSLRASGPVKLGASMAPQAGGPVSLQVGGIAYQPQVDRSRLAAKPAEAPAPPVEAQVPPSAEQSEETEE